MKKKKKKNIKKNINHKKKKIVKKQKRKLNLRRLLMLFLILILVTFVIKLFLQVPVRNIYIKGNTNLKDQEIIEISKLEDYPSMFKYSSKQIEKKLEKNIFIKNATVKKKKLKEIHIEIEENTVLFYNSNTKKTVLLNKKEVKKELKGPNLINYVPDKVYKKLKEKMALVNVDIIQRISEIKYDPSNVDEERFLFTMNDGNYVYITLEKLESINNYTKISLEIINKFGKKNGTLNLDAGEYFEIFNE